MRVLVAILVSVSIVSTASGQRLSTGAGRVFEEVVVVDDERIEYENAKKITFGVVPPPSYDVAVDHKWDLDTASAGQTGNVSYWNFKVMQVIDPNNFLATLGRNTYWIQDYPTKGLVDEQVIRIVDPIKYIGPKQYTSVLGANLTVRAIKLVDKETQLAMLNEQRKALLKPFELKSGEKFEAEILSYNSKTKSFDVLDTAGETRKVKIIDLVEGATKDELRKRMKSSK